MESLYFIALIPPPEILAKAEALKEEVWQKFGSKHALRSPSHITLHMPFRWKEKRRPELVGSLKLLASESTGFPVTLEGFDFFEPRVVYIDVEPTPQLLDLHRRLGIVMKQRLNIFNANYKDKPFHPHMTIGFRDLKKNAFYQAKTYYSACSFSDQFMAESLSLLKHTGRRWEIYEMFRFLQG